MKKLKSFLFSSRTNIKAFSVALLVFAMMVTAVATGITVQANGYLSVSFNVACDQELRDDLAEAMADVDVYLVATAYENSEGGYSFEYAPPFNILEEQFNLNETMMFGSMSDLTKAVKGMIGDVEPCYRLQDVAVVGGGIDFDEMGLYLVVLHSADVGEDTYTFNPVLLSMPAMGTSANFDPDDPTGGIEWQYSYTVFFKPEKSGRIGRLEIVKKLSGYVEGSPTTFVFEITGVKDGEIVYSNVEAITFDAPGQRTLLIDDLPVGAEVTVREVYPDPDDSGSKYVLTSDSSGIYTIIPKEEEGDDGPPTAEFTNDYNGGLNTVGGVTNSFAPASNGFGYVFEGQTYHQ